jgi:hypothetical protein
MSAHRIKVSNEQPSFTTLWLEPWGEDYGMLPGDEFEVLALDAADDFYFHLAFDQKGVKVRHRGHRGSTEKSSEQNLELVEVQEVLTKSTLPHAHVGLLGLIDETLSDSEVWPHPDWARQSFLPRPEKLK